MRLRFSLKQFFAVGFLAGMAFLFSPAGAAEAYTPTSTTGVFTSSVKDYGFRVAFGTFNWNDTVTASSTVTMRVRAGNTSTPDGTWTAWTSIAKSGDLSAQNGNRYLQYEATLSTVDAEFIPSLDDVTVTDWEGQMISSPYNTKNFGNALTTLAVTAAHPGTSQIYFQIRTSPDNVTWSSWCGPDNASPGCSATTYFTVAGAEAIDADFKDRLNDMWFQIKIILTGDYTTAASPTLTGVTLSYDTQLYTGVFTSSIGDLGGKSYFGAITWNSTTTVASGDTLTMRARIGNAADLSDASWFAVSNSSSLSAYNGNRYVQYEATFSTYDTYDTLDNFSLNDINLSYSNLPTSTALISSIYDSGDSANVLAHISWTSSTMPSGAQVKFQVRTGSSTTTLSAAAWVGPDGTAATYFTDPAGGENTSSTMRDGLGDQFMQYKAYFISDGFVSPSLTGVTVTYVVNASPEIQTLTASQNSDGTVTISYQVRDMDTASDNGSVNAVTPSFQYCVNGGGSCSAITALSALATSPKYTATSTWSTYTALWTPVTDFPNIYDGTATVKVTVNDLQAANNTAVTSSASFTLDTVAPTSGPILVDASSTPALLTLSAYDDSGPVTVRYATSTGALSAAAFQAFTTPTSTKTFTITDPSTIYAQFKDANSNVSPAINVTTPNTPSNVMIQDTSNLIVNPAEYRLFVAWKKSTAPPQGSFAAYRIYRSTDQMAWSLLTSIADINTNFYTDITAPLGVSEYYKITSVDSLGNVSFSSGILWGIANGIQDAGEGGGGTASPPTITSVATSSIDASNATITWDTAVGQLSNSTVGYSTASGTFTNQVTVVSYLDRASGIGPHSVLLAGLTPNTTYYFAVSSTNSSGNTGRSNNGGPGYVFTTTPGPSISPGPSVSSVSNRTAGITWGTDIAANSTVFFATNTSFASASSTTDGSLVTSHTINLSGLATSTKYYFYVRSVDGSGNINTDKNVVAGVPYYYSFNTSNDVTAPTFSGFSVTVNTTSAGVIWTTNKLSDSQIQYGTSTAYSSSTTKDATLTVQHNANLTGLIAGTLYHYRALSTDINSNAGVSGDQTFTTQNPADTIPPVISALTTSSVAIDRATISWTTSELANGTVDFGTTNAYGSLMGSLYDFTSSSHSVTLTSLLGNTTYYFRANSSDPAGNIASSTGSFTTVKDTTPPVISATSTLVNDTAAFVNWNTNELAFSYVNYGLTAGTLTNQVAVTSTPYISHSLPITGLSTLTTYYYQIVAADPSANTTTAPTLSFTTLASGVQTVTRIIDNTQPTDKIPPTVSNLNATNITAFGATLTWTTDEDGNSLIKYGRTTAYGSLAGDESSFGLSHSIPLVNLNPATTYHIKAVSFDRSGNIGSSVDQTFTTLDINGKVVAPETSAVTSQEEINRAKNEFLLNEIKNAPTKLLSSILDALVKNESIKNLSEDVAIRSFADLVSQIGAAPTIVGLRPTVEVHGNAATIKWSTDKKTAGMVSYAREADYLAGTDHPYTVTIVDSDKISTAHTVELTGLESATRYHFQVSSKGEIGPEGKSADYTFMTEAVLPAVTDVSVTDLKANEATIVWKTNVPTASTLEYTDLATNKTLTAGDPALLLSHNFLLQNLQSGVAYTLIIRAKNETGQESSSNQVNFKTTIDKEAPVITNVAANSTLYAGANSKVQTIISWDTSEPAITQVFYQEGVADDVNKIMTTTPEASFALKHFVVRTALKPGLVYKYWIEATDQTGNKSVSDKITTLTPLEKQTIIDIIGTNFQQVFGWTKNVKF